MKILKSHPLLKMVNSYLINSPLSSHFKLMLAKLKGIKTVMYIIVTLIVFCLVLYLTSKNNITYMDKDNNFVSFLKDLEGTWEPEIISTNTTNGNQLIKLPWGLIRWNDSSGVITILPKSDLELSGRYVAGIYSEGGRCLGGILHYILRTKTNYLVYYNMTDFPHVQGYLNDWAHQNDVTPLSTMNRLKITHRLINDLGTQEAYELYMANNPGATLPQDLPDPLTDLSDRGISSAWASDPEARLIEYRDAWRRAQYMWRPAGDSRGPIGGVIQN